MRKFNFTNEDAKKMYETKIEKLKKIADERVDDTQYCWDETVKKYAIKMERIKKILHAEGISEQITAKMFKDIDTFLSKCSEKEFHIALIGAIKAGKSTLINAMLGHEYASTKVTPETAALTKFKKGENNYVKVVFYTSDEWSRLWRSAKESKATTFLEEYETLKAEQEKEKWINKNEKTIVCENQDNLIEEIQKWTSSKSACHYFVKEVEVGLKEFELPDGVVLVDTPGLDDAVDYRSDITRQYIDRANAVLVCVKSDALSGPELATIYSVFANTRYNPEKVYIIATQIDTLNRPIENWKLQQEEWIKFLKGKGAYESIDLAQKNLISVSAYMYTLLKEIDSLEENDDKYWDLNSCLTKLRIKMENINEHYRAMIDYTNIDLLKGRIQTEIVSNYKKLLLEDIIGAYNLCKESIEETMKRIKDVQNEIIETSQGDLEEMKKRQQKYVEKYKATEADKEKMETLVNRLSKVKVTPQYRGITSKPSNGWSKIKYKYNI